MDDYGNELAMAWTTMFLMDWRNGGGDYEIWYQAR